MSTTDDLVPVLKRVKLSGVLQSLDLRTKALRLLPIAPEEKQSCLEIDDPIERLRMVQDVLREVRKAEAGGKDP